MKKLIFFFLILFYIYKKFYFLKIKNLEIMQSYLTDSGNLVENTIMWNNNNKGTRQNNFVISR